MTKIEEAIIKVIVDITKVTTEIGKTQAEMANFMTQHLSNVTEEEKNKVLAQANDTSLRLQQLKDKAIKLETALKG